MRYRAHGSAETMGVRWPGLPVSPLLDSTISNRSVGFMSQRIAMFSTHRSLMDLDSPVASSSLVPSIITTPPPSPTIRPLASPLSFPSPLSLPPPRLNIPSPSKNQSSPVTPSSAKTCKCNFSSRSSACSCCMPANTPRSALAALSPQNVNLPKAVSIVKPVNSVESPSSLFNKESDVMPRRSDFSKKRPPKLQIPIQPSSPCFQERGDKDAWKDINVEGEFYGLACKKGRREVMEDAFCALPQVGGNPGLAFFGVFDGHGGRMAAEFAAQHLAHNIFEAVESRGQKEEEGCVESAVRAGYLSTDSAFLRNNVSSGASCVTALMKDGKMVVANAGDCRAVVSLAGLAEALTSDHRVDREDERRRIENLGGYVDCYGKVWRLQGSLAISRGIGDSCYKKWISAEPEIKTLHLSSDCEFLILASDGLWDVMSNQEAVDCASSILNFNDTRAQSCMVSKENSAPTPSFKKMIATPLMACQQLVNVAVGRGSLDDVTVMLLSLQHFVKT